MPNWDQEWVRFRSETDDTWTRMDRQGQQTRYACRRLTVGTRVEGLVTDGSKMRRSGMLGTVREQHLSTDGLLCSFDVAWDVGRTVRHGADALRTVGREAASTQGRLL
jgi:hypothetical protein